MVVRRPSGVYTFSDFLELIRSDQKADLIDGVIYMASPENLEHNNLVRWLTIVLGQFVEVRELSCLTMSRVAYRLSENTAPEPDLAVVLSNRLNILQRGFVDGAPDLAIEIVSPDSIDRDYELKRQRYESAGVSEYWIIDPLEKIITLLARPNKLDDGFSETLPEGSIFRSKILPGFFLDSTWLWKEPLPATIEIVRTLLDEQ